MSAPIKRKTSARAAPAVNRGGATALYEQIAEKLAADIRSRRLKAFDKLPSEQELMAQFGVSRVTVRQALRKLADASLVISRQGKGVFVAGALVSHELNALHGFYDGLVAQGLNPQSTVLSFECVSPRTVKSPELAQFEYDIYRFRRLYQIGDMPIAVADVSVPSFGRTVTREDVEQFPVYSVIQNIIKRGVARSSAQVSAWAADTEVARLLNVEPGTPVLRMDRSSFDAKGLWLETTRFHIQPEVFAFQLDVEGPLQITSSIRRVDK
jgi:GntR family transcriptional regulator